MHNKEHSHAQSVLKSGICNQVRKHLGSCHWSLTLFTFTFTFTSLVNISIYCLRENLVTCLMTAANLYTVLV